MSLPLTLYRWAKADQSDIFILESSKKHVISNKEYLSVSKGVGGHIIGFFEYDKITEDQAEKFGENRRLNFKTISENKIIFGQDRDLIVIQPFHLKSLVEEHKIVDVELPVDDEEALKRCIIPSSGVLKHAKLGMLMGDLSNATEHNFIGDHIFQIKVLKNAYSKSYEEIRAFIDPIYFEAQSIGGHVTIEDKVETTEYDCPVTGIKRSLSNTYESESQSQKDDDTSLFIRPIKRIKGKGRKKTLRRKRHRRLRTRKMTCK